MSRLRRKKASSIAVSPSLTSSASALPVALRPELERSGVDDFAVSASTIPETRVVDATKFGYAQCDWVLRNAHMRQAIQHCADSSAAIYGPLMVTLWRSLPIAWRLLWYPKGTCKKGAEANRVNLMMYDCPDDFKRIDCVVSFQCPQIFAHWKTHLKFSESAPSWGHFDKVPSEQLLKHPFVEFKCYIRIKTVIDSVGNLILNSDWAPAMAGGLSAGGPLILSGAERMAMMESPLGSGPRRPKRLDVSALSQLQSIGGAPVPSAVSGEQPMDERPAAGHSPVRQMAVSYASDEDEDKHELDAVADHRAADDVEAHSALRPEDFGDVHAVAAEADGGAAVECKESNEELGESIVPVEMPQLPQDDEGEGDAS